MTLRGSSPAWCPKTTALYQHTMEGPDDMPAAHPHGIDPDALGDSRSRPQACARNLAGNLSLRAPAPSTSADPGAAYGGPIGHAGLFLARWAEASVAQIAQLGGALVICGEPGGAGSEGYARLTTRPSRQLVEETLAKIVPAP